MGYRQAKEDLHGIAQISMSIWDSLHIREKWGYDSPFIPLYDTNYFAPGKIGLYGGWIKDTDLKLKDILKEGEIGTYLDLRENNEMF